jgi:hypothetical protein
MKILFTLLLVLISDVSFANVKSDGNALLGNCLAAENFLDNNDAKGVSMFDVGYCMGLVRGVADTMVTESTFNKHDKFFDICFPNKGIGTGQLIRVVVKYLKNNPERLHFNDSILISFALKRVFACDSSQ